MGKSPGKWFKSVILGKKSSRFNLSKVKRTLKSAKKEEVLVSSKVPISDLTVDPLLILPPAPVVVAKSGVESQPGAAAELQNKEITLSGANDAEVSSDITNLCSQEDPERIRHEKAVTKAQAAFRGYQARRAFRTVKGVIRLQALIRGHLVRRQASSTLHCMWAIVKFQALVRGQKVRCSTIGIEVQNVCNLGKVQDAKCSDFSRTCTSTLANQLIENAFAQKVLASSSATLLHLQYGPGEPNAASEWLERWTISRFWEYCSKPKKNLNSKSQSKHESSQRVETGQGRPKRSIQKHFNANAENSSSRSTSESEKPKRNPRKVSKNTANPVQEHPQNELGKVKCNLKKSSDPKKKAGERFQIDSGKPKRILRKVSSAAGPEVPEQGTNGSTSEMKSKIVAISNKSDDDANLELPPVEEPVGSLHDHPDSDLESKENNAEIHENQGTNKQLNLEEHHVSNEHQKTSQRRATFPPNIEQQENGIQTMLKVPSYMAPTESARAKLRGQGSPRFSQTGPEKNGTTRRHSLPSSTNGLTTMSPHAQNLVYAAGKGLFRNDRSLSSSRDGSAPDKVIRAEWRR